MVILSTTGAVIFTVIVLVLIVRAGWKRWKRRGHDYPG